MTGEMGIVQQKSIQDQALKRKALGIEMEDHVAVSVETEIAKEDSELVVEDSEVTGDQKVDLEVTEAQKVVLVLAVEDSEVIVVQ